MKTIYIILIIHFLFIALQGQVVQKNTDEYKVNIPVFKGILEILNDQGKNHSIGNYCLKNTQNCQDTTQSVPLEMSVVRFFIHPDGTLSGFTVINSGGPELDEEFIRFIKTIDKIGKPDSLKETPVKLENDILMLPEINHDKFDNPAVFFRTCNVSVRMQHLNS